VFRLRFPVASVLDDDTPVAARARMPAAEPPGGWVAARPGAKVLAVDDDETILAALDALLRQWRFDVRLARSAAEARARIETAWQPELLLLDRRLPDADGARLAGELQAACARSPACLVITGDTAPDDLQALHASGFRVLYKPVGTDRLGAALRDLGF
jgi:DNA-binding NtrC family response regulator